MVTEKQLAANRANAQKSTGPRTPEGKCRASHNALKHGVLAKAILIQGECEEAFLRLCKAYVHEYSPQTPTEHALVNKAVTAQWRALRAASLESAAITHEILRQSASIANEDDTTRAMLAVRALNETSAHMERLSLYEHRFDLQHRHAIRDLQRLREKRSEAQGPSYASVITCACNADAQEWSDGARETELNAPSSLDTEPATCASASEPQHPSDAELRLR